VIIAMTAGRFARVLSIGLASGLDIIDSIEIGGRSTGQAAFTEECSRMATQLRTGQALQDVLVDSKYVPQFAKRMLSAGKDANELSKACEVVSRYYERDAAHLLKNINTIIEPVITVVMAGVVLLVALSVFLPMWQITQVRH
jgi:type II secretory pathway component PulF